MNETNGAPPQVIGNVQLVVLSNGEIEIKVGNLRPDQAVKALVGAANAILSQPPQVSANKIVPPTVAQRNQLKI